MPSLYKTLGQISPAANTTTNVYVSPAVQAGGSSPVNTVIGTLTVHNHTDANASYSFFVRPIAQTLADKHFIIKGGIVPARELVTITGAVCMNSSVILAANTNKTGITFNAYGAEIYS